MSDQEDIPPRVFARLDTLCGCTRFVSIQDGWRASDGGPPKSLNIPVVTRDGITERRFVRDLDAEGSNCEGRWMVGDVLVFAYREDS